jgi:hypothetical protein
MRRLQPQGLARAAAAALAVAFVGGSCLPDAQAVTTEQLLFLEVRAHHCF